MTNVSKGLAVIALLLAMAMWGSSFVAFKYALQAFDPVVIVFGRMILALMLFLVALPMWRPVKVDRKDLGLMGFMALCEPCLYFVFEGQALRYTTASQAGMVAAILPVLVAVAAWVFLKEKLTGQTWAGLALALGGVVWVSLGGVQTETSPRPLLGNFLELLAMTCASGYTISMKRLCAKYSPWFLTAVQAFVGSLFFLPQLFLPTTTLPAHLPLSPTLAVVYLGTCISVGAYGFYNYGISKLPAWQASAFINLIPVFSLVMGWAWLGEQFTLQQICGALVVFAGVLLTQNMFNLNWFLQRRAAFSVGE